MTVKAVVDWISKSPYSSIISAIEAVNEPRPYTTEQLAMLRSYYERTYATIQTLGDKAPAMMFADVRDLFFVLIISSCWILLLLSRLTDVDGGLWLIAM